MSKSEDDAINELVGSSATPAQRVTARRLVRMSRLSIALLRKEESSQAFVVATADGRTLEFMSDNQLGLDVGDSPKHWTEERADVLARQWNQGDTSKDQVVVVHWRVHYTAQVERLKALAEQYNQSPAA